MACADRGAIARANEHTLIGAVRQSIPAGTDTAVAHRRMTEGGFQCEYWAALPLDESPDPRVDFLRCERRQPSATLPDNALRVSLVHSNGTIDEVWPSP